MTEDQYRTITHDIRNDLSVILAGVALEDEKSIANRVRSIEHLTHILDAVSHLREPVVSLVSASDVSSMFADSIGDFEVRIHQPIAIDKTLLCYVIEELSRNNQRFAIGGSSVSVSRNAELLVVVSRSGTDRNLSKKQLKSMKKFRERLKTANYPDGYGYGLWLVDEIAKQFNGSLRLEYADNELSIIAELNLM